MWCSYLYNFLFCLAYSFLNCFIIYYKSLLGILDKKVVPKAANDVKLISAGKILENNKTVAQCRLPFGELPGGVITMHVVVQPSLIKTKTGMLYLNLS